MAFDDLPLERSDPAPPGPIVPPPPASSPTRWIVLGAAAIVLGAGLTWWWLSRAQPNTVSPAATTATEAAVPRNRPKSQNWDLPSLDASDSFLRPLVAALSQRPELARLLATQGLIRNATLATVQIGDGKTPASPFAVLRPTSRLSIIGNAPTGKIDPATYTRWDGATAALVSIRPADLAQLYVNLGPLFDQAYIELGHPGGKFDEALVKAIDTLTETPLLDQDPVLVRKQPGFYEHENQTLRTLLPVQKQFLLLGPENRRKIIGWLKDVAGNLDLKIG
ncbi:MAG TPA: DUF3014 domain-containing protein [Vicinamibacterales bacterium]|nr:DUF3014 domain-containing protein [Vicinamibacterales bacterium]